MTFAGWGDAIVHDWGDIDAERKKVERAQDEQQRKKMSSCWAFWTRSGGPVSKHNEQVAKLISDLGDNSAGRRVVLRAVAKPQGFDDEDAVEDMLHGRSGQKIDVPSSLRGAFNEIGLAHVVVFRSILPTAYCACDTTTQ